MTTVVFVGPGPLAHPNLRGGAPKSHSKPGKQPNTKSSLSSAGLQGSSFLDTTANQKDVKVQECLQTVKETVKDTFTLSNLDSARQLKWSLPPGAGVENTQTLEFSTEFPFEFKGSCKRVTEVAGLVEVSFILDRRMFIAPNWTPSKRGHNTIKFRIRLDGSSLEERIMCSDNPCEETGMKLMYRNDREHPQILIVGQDWTNEMLPKVQGSGQGGKNASSVPRWQPTEIARRDWTPALTPEQLQMTKVIKDLVLGQGGENADSVLLGQLTKVKKEGDLISLRRELEQHITSAAETGMGLWKRNLDIVPEREKLVLYVASQTQGQGAKEVDEMVACETGKRCSRSRSFGQGIRTVKAPCCSVVCSTSGACNYTITQSSDGQDYLEKKK